MSVAFPFTRLRSQPLSLSNPHDSSWPEFDNRFKDKGTDTKKPLDLEELDLGSMAVFQLWALVKAR